MIKRLSRILGEIPRIIISSALFATALITEKLSLDTVALILYILALAVAGLPVLASAIRGILRRDLLDEKFLMSIASVGAMIVGEWSEGVAVMLFFLIGETFEHSAVRRSRSSIRALMDICPDEATVLTDSGEETVDAEDVEPGSIIIVRPGERVPIDSVILSGTSDIDTSAMTGESIPRRVTVGDSLDSGVVVIDGLLTCRTLRPSGDSAAARVLELVENATENKSREENFITKFSHYYTPTVVISAILLAFIPAIFGLMNINDSIYRALIFLVVSCPCALVISVPMAFFGGIGGAASRGILFKGGNVFSPLAKADTVALDKTGTITGGSFSVVSVNPVGIDRDELLYIAASVEQGSNHPIAACIRDASVRCSTPSSVTELAGEGVTAILDGRPVAVGNASLMHRLGITPPDSTAGCVFVAADGRLVGTITLSDTIRPEASSAISRLRSVGVRRTVMLTGDRASVATAVAASVGIDELRAELKPEDKYRAIEELIATSHGTVYIGDGINDAPSLARADVGIAMGSIGQDCAIEAADAVIMSDNLTKISEAIQISRKTINIAKQNIIFALGVKGLILILGAFGFANMWLAVFADVGVAVLAILNSMRAMRAPRGV